MMRVKLGRMAVICSILVAGIVGCGGDANTPQPVSGTVTIKGGGPVPRGSIRFTNVETKKTAIGDIDAKGNFTLSSAAKNDGAPAGNYTVTLANTHSGGTYDKPTEKAVEIIDTKYNSDTTTDCKQTVKSGSNVLKIELDPAK